MDTVLEQINSAGVRFVEFAFTAFIQSSVLIVILLLLDFALRKKIRAVFRYWIWMLVLVKLLLPTTLSSPASLGYWLGDKLPAVNINNMADKLNPPIVSPAVEPARIETKSGTPTVKPPQTTLTSPPADSKPTLIEPPVSPLVSISATSITWQAALFLVWLAIVAAMAILLLQRAIFVCGLVAQAKDANDLMNDTLDYCRGQMGVKRKVGLKVSANATSPAVSGLFRPVILIPENLAPSLGASGLRVVLMHELAHIKRGDLWVNLVQTILQIIYFYNLLLWLANLVIRRVREQAVDEMVLVAMGKKAQQYSQTLVDVAKLAFKRPALSLRLIGVVESKSALSGRVKRILNRPIPKSAKLGIAGLLAITVVGAVLLPMAKVKKTQKILTTLNENSWKTQLAGFWGKRNFVTPDITIFAPVEENGNLIIRAMQHSYARNMGTEARITVKDHSLRLIAPNLNSIEGINTTERFITSQFNNIALDQVSEILFQTRPYQWVKTDVQIEIEKSTEKYEARKAKYENPSDKMRVVRELVKETREMLKQRRESFNRLRKIGIRLTMYAEDHGGSYPKSLDELSNYAKEDLLEWAKDNIKYLGRGKSSQMNPQLVIAYDQRLLNEENSKGTNVLYNSCWVEFVGAEQFIELGDRIAIRPWWRVSAKDANMRLVIKRNFPSMTLYFVELDKDYLLELVSRCYGQDITNSAENFNLREKTSPHSIQKQIRFMFNFAHRETDYERIIREVEFRRELLKTIKADIEKILGVQVQAEDNSEFLGFSYTKDDVEGNLNVSLTLHDKYLSLQFALQEVTLGKVDAAEQVEGEQKLQDRESRKVNLPDVDESKKMLDLSSGKLFEIPSERGTYEDIDSAIKKFGKGDLIYDGRVGSSAWVDPNNEHRGVLVRGLFFARNATIDVPADLKKGPFKGLSIPERLPIEFAVTTKEGREYKIKILSADNESCQLQYRPIEKSNEQIEREEERAETKAVPVTGKWQTLSFTEITDGTTGKPSKSVLYELDSNGFILGPPYENNGRVMVDYIIFSSWDGYEIRVVALDKNGKTISPATCTWGKPGVFESIPLRKGHGMLTFENLLLSDIEELLFQIQPVEKPSLNAVGPQWVASNLPDGVDSFALQFDGVDDYVSLATDDSLDFSRSFSVSTWVNPESKDQHIFTYYDRASTRKAIHIKIYSNGKVRFGFYRDDLNTDPQAVSFNIWSQVVCTYDYISDTSKIYINGVLAKTGNSGPYEGSHGHSWIGKSWTSEQGFDGTIDEVTIYNRALSAEEIQVLMHIRPDTDEPNLVGYWNFDEGSGKIANDLSLNKNHGRLIESSQRFSGVMPHRLRPIEKGEDSKPNVQIEGQGRIERGSGTETDPYVITDVYQLQRMQDDLDVYYVLGNDINATETKSWNGGEGFVPIGSDAYSFTGSFDGQGYTINNLYIDRINTKGVGLFCRLSGATIKNVHLTNGYIRCDTGGILAARAYESSTVYRCSSTGTVILRSGYDDAKSGGLIGSAGGGSYIDQCCSGVNIEADNRKQVGSLIGYLRGRGYNTVLSNSYSYGTVTGSGSKQGNLLGDADASHVDRCYSCGNGKALIGFNFKHPVITNCYWDKDKGASSRPYGGTPKTTTQMMQQATFVDWDFDEIWDINEGQCYPYFQEPRVLVGLGIPGPDEVAENFTAQYKAVGPQWVASGLPDGVDGFALQFDGRDDCVKVKRSKSLEPESEITVEMWALLDGQQSPSTRLLRKAGHYAPGYILAADQVGDRRIQFRVDLPGDVAFAEDRYVAFAEDRLIHNKYIGQWHHFAGVYSKTHTTLYIDGIEINRVRHDGRGMVHSPVDLYIGHGAPSGPREHFKGLIDDVRIWDIARSAEEIKQTMRQRLHGSEVGLIGYWNFDEGSGKSANDLSLNKNHGRLIESSQHFSGVMPYRFRPMEKGAKFFFQAPIEFKKDISITRNAVGEFRQMHYRNKEEWITVEAERYKVRASLYVNTIRFEKSLFKRNVSANLKIGYSSWPKALWQITVKLLDNNEHILIEDSSEFETTGNILSGQVLRVSSELEFSFGRWKDISKAATFVVTVTPLQENASNFQQDAEDTKSEFKVTLPNGVTVELVGVCEHPSEGKQWWQPDGSLLGQGPVRNIDVGGYNIRRGEAAYELVAKLAGPETLLSRSSTPEKWKIPQARKVGLGKSGTAKDKNGVPCLRATTAIVKNGLEKIDIEFGLAGVWEKKLTIFSNESSKQKIGDTGVVINPPYEKDSNATITIKIPNKIDSKMAINITAVLKNGKVIDSAARNRNSKIRFMRSTDNYEFHGVNLSDVDHFEIYTSKYQWVKFKNVSLKPNFKTDVQIEVEKSTGKNKARKAKYENPSDKMRVVRELVKETREMLKHRKESLNKLRKIGMRLTMYAEDHGGDYPEELDELSSYAKEDILEWAKDNVNYLGRGKSSKMDPQLVIAYDQRLLNEENSGGTNVLYNSCWVEFVGAEQFIEWGDRIAIRPWWRVSVKDANMRLVIKRNFPSMTHYFIEFDEDYLLELVSKCYGQDITNSAENFNLREKTSPQSIQKRIRFTFNFAHRETDYERIIREGEFRKVLLKTIKADIENILGVQVQAEDNSEFLRFSYTKDDVEGSLNVYLTLQYKYLSLHFDIQEVTLGKVDAAEQVEGEQKRQDRESRKVNLPDVDESKKMLDLSSGKLIEIPSERDTYEDIDSEIKKFGKGDLIYDGRVGNSAWIDPNNERRGMPVSGLFLARNATIEMPVELKKGPFKGLAIPERLPIEFAVTTKEGRGYKVKILSADDDGCWLQYRQIEQSGEQVESECTLEKDLIAYWDFDGDANDLVGDNHGTVYGAVLTKGVSGQGYLFEGDGDCISIPDSEIFDFGNEDLTISAWFKTSINKDPFPFIINFRQDDNNPHIEIYASRDVGSHLLPGYTRLTYPEGGIDDCKWHHVAITLENGAENGYRLYLDGTKVAQTTYTGRLEDWDTITIGGQRKNGKKEFAFGGFIDEVAIYKRVLYEDEIKSIYNSITEAAPATGEWQTLSFTEVLTDATTGKPSKSVLYEFDSNGFILGSSHEKNGRVMVDFINFSSWDGYKIRVVALDKNGKTLSPATWGRPSVFESVPLRKGHWMLVFEDLLLSDIKEFQFQIQPVKKPVEQVEGEER